ncbi:thermonuclease family protein [Desulfurivibrio sp. C05AmB]|uniref:thermonuclease family protein n=1 Tax=Desulfurivibrio sp. C05AmB TaxID=3374371 RepID=UPI00376EBA35
MPGGGGWLIKWGQQSVQYAVTWAISKQPVYITSEPLHDGTGHQGLNPYRIILDDQDYGIDAPESGQPFGRASTGHVKKVIGGAGFQVEITEIDRDRYGRIVGMVIVNCLNLNRDLVKNPVKYGIWVCWPEREEYVTGRIQSMGKPLPA